MSRVESAYLPPRAATQAGARDRIVAVATRLFYKRGIRNVGVDLVIAESGVAKTTLYKHFRSKDALIAECLHRLDDRYFRWFESEVEAKTDDPHGRLAALFEVLDDWFQRPDFRGCAFINASLEINRPGHPVRESALAHLRALEELVHQLLIEAGVDDADLTAQVVLLVDGAYAVGGTRRDPAAARRAKAVAAALLAGRLVS